VWCKEENKKEVNEEEEKIKDLEEGESDLPFFFLQKHY